MGTNDPDIIEEIANNYGSFTPVVEAILGSEVIANAGNLAIMPTCIKQIRLGRAKLEQYKQIVALAGKHADKPELQQLLKDEAQLLLYEGTGILAAASGGILGTTETMLNGWENWQKKDRVKA